MTAETGTGGAMETPGIGRWLILAGVWLIYLCFGVIIASMAPLIGPIGADLQIGNGMMGVILGAWPLAYIFAAIPCGLLLDRLGSRRVLFLATLIMAASSLARSYAQTPVEMLAAVALFGLGGPMISVGAPKVIAGLFTGTTRATAMGIYMTGPFLGGLLALALTNSVAMPLVGGDWREVMRLYAALVAGSGLVWLGLSGGRKGGRSGADDGGKKFHPAAFADILRVPEVRLVLWLSIGVFFINHGLNNWLPSILITRGMTEIDAGYWASVPSAVGVVAAVVVPRFATPNVRIFVMAALVGASLMASLLLHLGPGVLLGFGLLLQGVARGAMMTVAVLLLMETPRVPQERLGLAGGMFFTAAEIGGVAGPMTFGALSAASGGFTLSLVSMSLVCLALLGLLARLRRLQAMA
jgi:CP family cyanate transporter-like MFS transporter